MNLEELKSSADQLANNKSYNEAVSAYNKILLDTGFLGHQKISTVYFNKGFCLYNLKSYKEATECFKQALNRDGNYAKSYYYLGLSFLECGNFDSSLEAFVQAKKTDPKLTELIDKKIKDIKDKLLNTEAPNVDLERLLTRAYDTPTKQKINRIGASFTIINTQLDSGSDLDVIMPYLQTMQILLEEINFAVSKEDYFSLYEAVYLPLLNRIDINKLPNDYVVLHNSILVEYLFDVKKIKKFDESPLTTKFGFNMDCLFETFDSLLYVDEELSLDYVIHNRSTLATLSFTLQNIIHFLKTLEDTLVHNEDSRLVDKISIIINAMKSNNTSGFVVYLEMGMLNCVKNQVELVVIKELCATDAPESDTLTKVCRVFTSMFNNATELLSQLALSRKDVQRLLLEGLTSFMSNKAFCDALPDKTLFFEGITKLLIEYPNFEAYREQLVLVQLLTEMRAQRRLEYSAVKYELVRGLLNCKNYNNPEVLLHVLHLLVNNATYLQNLLSLASFLNFITQLDLTNKALAFHTIELFYNIFSNTYEQKVKMLKENYDVSDANADSFNKLLKLMHENGVNLIREAQLKSMKLHEFLVDGIKIQKLLLTYFEPKTNWNVHVLAHYLFVVEKVVKDYKFRAPLFVANGIFDKMIIFDLKIKQTNKTGQTLTKDEISSYTTILYELMARIMSGVEIQQINDKYSKLCINLMAKAATQSSSQMTIFECIYAFVRFAQTKTEYNSSIWQNADLKNLIYESFYNENMYIRSAAVQLMNDLLNDFQICTAVMNWHHFRSFMDVCIGYCMVFAEGRIGQIESKDISIGKEGNLVTICINVVLFIYTINEEYRSLIKSKVSFDKLKLAVMSLIKDTQTKEQFIFMIDAANN